MKRVEGLNITHTLVQTRARGRARSVLIIILVSIVGTSAADSLSHRLAESLLPPTAHLSTSLTL